MRGKPRSYPDLPTEEREQIDPHVHNNPPKILHPLNLVSPSLKIDHSTVQRLLEINSLFGLFIFITPFKTVGRKIGCFFVLYINEPTLNQKKSAVHDQKKRGGGGKKKRPPVEEKNVPLENKKYGRAEEK